jgi:hypothetical protein
MYYTLVSIFFLAFFYDVFYRSVMPTGIRSKENCAITISLPKSLVAQIDELARADRRNRSNWIVVQLEDLIKKRIGKSKIANLPRAATNIITASFCSAILQSVPIHSFA